MRTKLGILSCALVVGCGGGGGGEPAGPPPPAAVSTVSVEPTALTLLVGAAQALVATPRDAAGSALSGRSVTWLSGNTAVASVSSTGTVTGVTAGTTTITATSEGRSGSAQVTVLAPVASVVVSPATSSIGVGGTTTLTAVTLDASGASLTGRSVTWTSSNTGVASVSGAGTVTALAPGSVTITASSEGRAGTAQVVVFAPVASVVVTPATLTLLVGATSNLAAATLDAAGAALSGRAITWTSSNGAVASVSAPGTVIAIAPGTVTITATSEGRSGTAQVTVLAPVASVTVTPNAATLLPLGTTTLLATPRDGAGNALVGRTITWASSNPAIVAVSGNGVVTAIAPGVASVTATSEGQVGGALITVLAPVTSVTVTGSFRVKVGDTYTYTATARIADGTVVSRPLTWSVTNPARAAMSTGGAMTPLQTGAITIRAVVDGVAWDVSASAYDWVAFGSGTTQGVALAADNTITNKFGTSEYPDLVVGCAQGTMLVYVDTDHFVTSSGGVAYSFDGGTIFSRTWVESSDFSSLIYPSLSNSTTLAFVSLIAASRTFGFAFTEFNAGAKAMIFRVGGLGSLVSALVGPCALANTLAPSGSVDMAKVNALRSAAGKRSTPRADLAQRITMGPLSPDMPALVLSPAPREHRQAIRRPR